MRSDKRLLFVFLSTFFISCSLVSAASYYVDSISGSDSNAGTSSSVPWKTIGMVNSQSFSPGDNIYFKRDSFFNQTLNMSSSGSAGNLISFGAYGSGNNPTIRPTVNVTGWSVYSGNIYVANVSLNVTQVFVDGVFYNRSSYPDNYFLNATANTNNYQLTDSNLTLNSSDIINATVKVMTSNWFVEERVIENFNNSTKTFNWSTATDYNITQGYGYYLEDKLWMLNTGGEWWYNSTSNQLYIQVVGNEDPSTHDVQVSNGNYGIFSNAKKYFQISDLNIEKTKDDSIYLDNTNNSKIYNLRISDVGNRGIYVHGSDNCTILNVTVTNSRKSGLIASDNTNMSFLNSTYENTGLVGRPVTVLAGAKLYSDNASEYSNTLFEGNHILNTAYIGVRIEAWGYIVNKNFINNTCVRLDDCGLIYSWQEGQRNDTGYRNVITNNILANGIGNPPMQKRAYVNQAYGIYLDKWTYNFTVINNTIFNTEIGIYAHNSFNHTIQNNTVYNARNGSMWIKEDTFVNVVGQVYGISVLGNIFHTASSDTPPGLYYGLLGNLNFGTINYNYYGHPSFEFPIVRKEPSTVYYSNTTWRTTGFDNDSVIIEDGYKINRYRINSTNYVNRSIFANTQFNTSITGWSGFPGYNRTWQGVCPINNDGCYSAIKNDSSTNTHLIISPSFSVVQGNAYEVKFKVLSNVSVLIRPIVRRSSGAFESLGFDIQGFGLVANEVRNYSSVFVANITATGRFDIELSTNGTHLYLDDVFISEVNGTDYNDPSDDFLLVYNTEGVTKTFNLTMNYTTLEGTEKSCALSVEPYRSVLLASSYCNNDFVCNNKETYVTCSNDCAYDSAIENWTYSCPIISGGSSDNNSTNSTSNSTSDDESGGSGGSSGYRQVNISYIQLKQGYNSAVYNGWKAGFNFEQEGHTIQLFKLNASTATIRVQSEPQVKDILENTSEKFYLTNDSGITATLNKIINEKGKPLIANISLAIFSDNLESPINQNSDQGSESKEFAWSKTKSLFIVLIALAIFILILFVLKKLFKRN
jgi:parallel beta-helix repeat protein